MPSVSWLITAVVLASATCGVARAQTGPAGPDQGGAPAVGNQQLPGATTTSAPPSTGLWERTNLLGSVGGLRTLLDGHGISFGLTETSEILGNPTGGRARQLVYEGLTEMSVGVDMGKAVGLDGGTFNVSAFQIHGRGLSANAVPSLVPASSIEADRATRLYEAWYQQAFLGGRLDLRVGKLGADTEFMISQYSSLFISAGFGWPTLPALDQPAGGPAYPFASPGARLRVQSGGGVTVLAAVFNGSPAGLGPGDPQLRDPTGASLRFDDGVLAIGEVQYAINQGEGAAGLPGTYKVGAWYNSHAPGGRRSDGSFYGIVDQLLYRPPGVKDGGAGVFLRAMGAPSDRNPVSVFVDGGLTYKGAFGRAGDTIGVGAGWSKVSAAGFASVPGTATPLRGSEFLLELTYQAQVAPWWVVQPDAQYIVNPGGGVLNPNGSGKIVGNAVVLGVRTVVTFW